MTKAKSKDDRLQIEKAKAQISKQPAATELITGNRKCLKR